MATSHNRTLVILQRDNFAKDKDFIKALTGRLEPAFDDIRYFENSPSGEPLRPHTSVFLDSVGGAAILAGLPPWRRKLRKALLLLKYPSRWGHYVTWFRPTDVPIQERCRRLEKYIKSIKAEGKGREVLVLSRSSGGRVASLIADQAGMRKIVCLSYPFRHPENGIEPERYAHLEHIITPFLIFQGRRDEYGGSDVIEKYRFSPAVKIELVDAGHDFEISPEALDEIARRIIAFAG